MTQSFLDRPLNVLLFDNMGTYTNPLSETQFFEESGVLLERASSTASLLQILKNSDRDVILAAYPLRNEALRVIREFELSIPLILLCVPDEEVAAFNNADPAICDIVSVNNLARLPFILRRELLRHQDITIPHDPLDSASMNGRAIQSEARFRSIVEGFNDMILVVDGNHITRYSNVAPARVLGYKASDILGKSVASLLHPDEIPMIEQTLVNLAQSPGDIQSFEHQMRRVDGQWEFVETSAHCMGDPRGNPILVLHIHNISERKRVETALRESEAQYRLLAENMADVIWILDVATLRFTYVSPSVERLRGYPPEVVLQQPIEEVMTPASLALISADLPKRIKAFFEGDPDAVVQTHPIEQIRKDKSTVWTEVVTTLVGSNPGDLQIIGVSRDISARKTAEEALKESEKRYRQVLDNMMEGCQILDHDWRYLYLNDTALTQGRQDKADMLGYTIMERYPGIESSEVFAALTRSMVGRVTQQIENEFVYADGSKAWFDLRIQPVPEGIFILSLDISARKEAESVLRSTNDMLEQRVTERTAELEKVKNRIEAIFNHSGNGILLLDRDFCIQQANFAFSTLFKLSPEACFDTKFTQFFNSSDAEIINATMQEVVRTHQMRRLEVRAQASDGKEFDAEVNFAPVNHSDQEVTNLVCMLWDITERKQTQKAIAEERNLLRTLIDAVPDHIFVKDCNHRIVLDNVAHARLLGFQSPDQAIGARDSDVYPAHLTDRFEADENNVIASGQPMIASEEPTYNNDKDHEIWASTTKAPLRNLNGEIIGLVGITRDISAIKANEIALQRSENQLRESQRMLKTVLDTIPVRVFWKDRNSVYLGCNRLFAQDAGLAHSSDIVGKLDDDLPWVHLADAYRAGDREVIDSQDTKPDFEEPIFTASGNIISVQSTMMPLRDADGQVIGVLGSYTDITARKQVEAALLKSEAALRQSQKMLQIVLDTIPSSVFWKNRDSIYEGCNRRFAEDVGLASSADVVGKRDSDMPWPPEELEGYLSTDRDTITNGTVRRNEEMLKTIANGVRIVAQVNKLPLRNDRDEIIGVLGTYSDITEKKRAEEALRESETRFRHVVEAAPDYVFQYDTRGVIQMANPTALRESGYTQAEMIGHNMAEFFTPESRQQFANELNRTLKTGSHYLETQLVRKDGSVVLLEGSGSAIYGEDGKPQCIIAVKRDITRRRQAEEALHQALAREKEMNELKTRFVSMASHEFRTPLATILATTDTLSAYRHKLSEDNIEYRFNKIREQVGHLRNIMEDMLLISRMQSRRAEFNPTWADLDQFVREVLGEFRSRPEVLHRLDYTSSNVPAAVKFDAKLIRQILSNLIGNAIKYSPGKKSVAIHLDYSDGVANFIIRDEGIGIPATDLNRLYEPFHRAGNTGTIPGTGLGLTITKESVELHGGTISLRSQMGQGTEVTVRLPAEA